MARAGTGSPTAPLRAALVVHQVLTARVIHTVHTATTGPDVDQTRRDDECPFGWWLFGTMSENHRTAPLYDKTIDAHARYHREAARVLELSAAGHHADARAAIRPASPLSDAANSLTVVLLHWLGVRWPDEPVDLDDAATILDLTTHDIRRLVDAGQLEALGLATDRSCRVSAASLERYWVRRIVEPSSDTAAASRHTVGSKRRGDRS